MDDFDYALPEDRIASHPLAERDQSRLLVWQQGDITHRRFTDLPDLLPKPSTLFFNDTRVIGARFLFHKSSGAQIEIFLLEPSGRIELSRVLLSQGSCLWRCAIGNLRKWKSGELKLQAGTAVLTAKLVDAGGGIVAFSWDKPMTFAELLEHAGKVPLPPYIKRHADPSDKERYQTVYARESGAVAAPTAGLHFTASVLNQLKDRGIATEYLTLHVSAGTFLPVKTANALDHEMHEEEITFYRSNLEALRHLQNVIAVGTTAMRTLESIYWLGLKLMEDPESELVVKKMDPYAIQTKETHLPDCIEHLLSRMDHERKDALVARTSIFIVPGYKFRVCNGLITNFHQPKSTLILLIAAFLGPSWKNVYQAALSGDYRFLSYGDSSLLIP